MQIPRTWTFENADVAKGFDQHVREQLPWYDLVTGAVAHIARHYVASGGLVYDIGASTGNIGRALAPVLDERGARLVPIEASAEMAARYDGPGAERLIVGDALRVRYQPFDFAVCFLVLMFMQPAERGRYLRRLVRAARPGGAVVVVDKCQAVAGYPATVLARMTLAGKVAAAVPAAEIVAKELSLGGVQRPIAPETVSAIPGATEFFRFGEFAGWLIERPENPAALAAA